MSATQGPLDSYIALIKQVFTDNKIEEYEGYCGEAADLILHAANRGDILYIDGCNLVPTYNAQVRWNFHMVAVVDQLVLDPWSPHEPCSIREYVDKVFPGEEEHLSINGKDMTLDEIERLPVRRVYGKKKAM